MICLKETAHSFNNVYGHSWYFSNFSNVPLCSVIPGYLVLLMLVSSRFCEQLDQNREERIRVECVAVVIRSKHSQDFRTKKHLTHCRELVVTKAKPVFNEGVCIWAGER
jgi:hypothetical protein